MVPSNRVKVTIYIFLLLVIASVIFGYTVSVRKPWFGTLSPEGHQHLTGSAVKFSKNWYAEGPVKLKFGMFENPRSVEFPTLESREPYCSYPPGTILPLYLMSRIRGHEPTPSAVMAYNLLNQVLIAMFLSLTIFFFLLQLKFSHLNAFILSTIPILLELLMPGPMYWHQNVFFSDQAVILPFIVFIFLEVIRNSVTSKWGRYAIGLIQALVFFYGVLVDWLFIFVALVVYVKRILTGGLGKRLFDFLKRSVLYWIPLVLSLSLFLIQVHVLDCWSNLLDIGKFRAGLSTAGGKSSPLFVTAKLAKDMGKQYGFASIVLIWGSLVLFIVAFAYVVYKYFRKERVDVRVKGTLALMGILLVPPFLQVYILRGHTAFHSFSSLKFSLPFATVPLVLAPVLLCYTYGIDLNSVRLSIDGWKVSFGEKKRDLRLPIAIIGLFLVAVVMVLFQLPYLTDLFPSPGNYNAEEFIAESTGYEDIVFSPDYEIPVYPTQELSYSMKRVYETDSVSRIYEKVADIEEEYEIDLFFNDSREVGLYPELEKLVSIAYEEVKEDDHCLYRIRKEDFLEAARGIGGLE